MPTQGGSSGIVVDEIYGVINNCERRDRTGLVDPMAAMSLASTSDWYSQADPTAAGYEYSDFSEYQYDNVYSSQNHQGIIEWDAATETASTVSTAPSTAQSTVFGPKSRHAGTSVASSIVPPPGNRHTFEQWWSQQPVHLGGDHQQLSTSRWPCELARLQDQACHELHRGDAWAAHIKTHLQGHYPFKCCCLFCDKEFDAGKGTGKYPSRSSKEVTSAMRERNFQKRLNHIRNEHLNQLGEDAVEYMKTDFHLLSYLHKKRVLSATAWQSVLKLMDVKYRDNDLQTGESTRGKGVIDDINAEDRRRKRAGNTKCDGRRRISTGKK